MKVYELFIDFDCTTRSHPQSYGLFKSRDTAVKALLKYKLHLLQFFEIKEVQLLD